MKAAFAFLLALIAAPAFAAATLNIDSIAGLYTSAPPNPSTDSGKANNVLEVVKLSQSTAYVRIHLGIGTGICSFWGVARTDQDTLVLKDHDPDDRDCELRIRFSPDMVKFVDRDDRCRMQNCGVSADFESAEFSVKSRRPITYMKRLLASRAYQDAMRQNPGK